MSLRPRRLLILLALGLATALASAPAQLGCSSGTEWSADGAFVTAPDFGGRVDAALAGASRARLGSEARSLVETLPGKVAVDAPDRVSGWPEKTEVVALLDTTTRELLLGDDEAAVARALRQAGVGAVAVHWPLQRTLDRGRAVMSRLVHHDHLDLFRLERVTDDLFIYRVLETPMAFPPNLAALMVQALREHLRTGEPAQVPEVASPDGDWEFMATIRGQGRELAVGLARHRSLKGALEELGRDLERGHRRYAEWYGFPPLKDHINDLSIEVLRITERAAVEPRGEADLEDIWELGIDGAIIRDFEARKAAMFPGAASYTRALRQVDQFLRHAADFHHMEEKRPWRDPQVALEILRTHHYREVPGQGLIYLYRGVPPAPMELVTIENTRKAIVAAGEWYLANLYPDGRVVYKWWPAENRESDEYNIVRHTLATWNLAQAYLLDPRPEFLEGAKRAQEYTLKYLVKEGDMAYISFNNNQKLGAVVVGLLGMIEVARIENDHSHDDLMREFARFVMFMQEPSGKFRGYHVEEDHPYADMENDIVPGEAALALIELAGWLDDPSYLEPLKAYWQYYMPWYRERAARKRPEAPWPRYVYDDPTRLELVQFGPWTVMAANAYHQATGDEEVARFGLEIARFMIDSYQWSEERAPFPDYVGGYYKLPYELPAMQAFCYAEGTAAAYQLALRMAPEEAPFFEKSTREAVRFGLQMQFDDLSTYPFSRPEQVRGGIRYAMNETKVRIDYVHHALSAMYQYLRGAEQDPNLPEHVKSHVPLLTERLAETVARREEAQAAAPEGGQ